jgi:hypothetical protein
MNTFTDAIATALAAPLTLPNGAAVKKIGVKKLDSIADLWWAQHQVQRPGAGTDPDPGYGPTRSSAADATSCAAAPGA